MRQKNSTEDICDLISAYSHEELADRFLSIEAKNKELLAKCGELELKIQSMILESNDIKNLEDHLQDAFPVKQK